MSTVRCNTNELLNVIKDLKVKDRILLSGTVYTARDAAHKRIVEGIKNGVNPPFEIKGATIYYAGPTPSDGTRPIGSCGPTTSGRMDVFTPFLLDKGLLCMIGKGPRNNDVIEAIKKNNAIYLCAIGGAGALASKCIVSAEVVAFEDLGCESVKKLEIVDFPLIVGIDAKGNSIFYD